MTNMLNPRLVLEAESIVTDSTPGGKVTTIILFHPDEELKTQFQHMAPGSVYDGLEIRDKFDNGEIDEHLNERVHRLISISCYHNKTHTYILTFSTL